MGNRKDDHEKKGPQAHAEGEHGDKTHHRLMKQLHEGESLPSREEQIARNRERAAYDGSRRLVEDREQHDEAEKNSEHTQLYIEHEMGRDQGPSDNTGNLHGVLGHREHRADNKLRDSKGLPPKR